VLHPRRAKNGHSLALASSFLRSSAAAATPGGLSPPSAPRPGVLVGLFGLGGGIVIVPALFFLYLRQGFPAELCMHLAVGSSLATVVFTSSLTSAMAHHGHGAIPSPVLGACGRQSWPAALGAVLAEHAPGRCLRVFFGLFELLVAAQLALAPRPDAHRNLPGSGGMWLVGTGIGALSTLLGIGGGR
jgi:uncharacterized membrane protein YfcA